MTHPVGGTMSAALAATVFMSLQPASHRDAEDWQNCITRLRLNRCVFGRSHTVLRQSHRYPCQPPTPASAPVVPANRPPSSRWEGGGARIDGDRGRAPPRGSLTRLSEARPAPNV